MLSEPQSTLKRYWGYDSFRPLQEDIITSVTSGKDVLALLPTGGGKSICFQVPAMMMEGICLVISPLIALMKDQVENLNCRNIPALAVYSGMAFSETKKTLQNAAFGKYKFLYVSPERLETKLFLEFLPAIKPALIAVDEAHCISHWGYDFRPSYLRIANLRNELPGTPVIALTASATRKVQDDICEKLLFSGTQQRFQQSFARPNLSYSIFEPVAKQTKLLEILKNVAGTAIVYCKSRKQTQQVSNLLLQNGIDANYYHAGLNNEERMTRQLNWINNKTRVIVSTNAFGMGIDKPDVRVVIHYAVPESLENYYQEAGRAGRDGKRAYAVLLFEQTEITTLNVNAEMKFPDAEKLKLLYTHLMNYLQVPAGIGEEQVFTFDIAKFADTFRLNIIEASYGLEALANEGLISFGENLFEPSTVVFSTTKEYLQQFEMDHPKLDVTIKGLLRNYEGIFDYPANIYETSLAKFIGRKTEETVQDLRLLEKHGILKYKPSESQSRIQLLMNRMYADDFYIDETRIRSLRANHLERLEAMTGFVHNRLRCRSRLIGSYFGDDALSDCGICDNCINNKTVRLSQHSFETIAKQIMQPLEGGEMNIKVLAEQLAHIPKKDFWQVLNFLISEDTIVSSSDGGLTVRKTEVIK